MLIPQVSKATRLGDRVADRAAREGASLEDILAALDEERESHYREGYARS